MKYPRLPEDLDKRRKLTADQIENIRKLYAEGGWTHRTLSEEFGVSKAIIGYYLFTNEKRKEINRHRYEKIIEQELFDPEIARKHKEQNKKSQKEVLKKLLEKRIYKGKETYKWKKKKYHTDEQFREKTKKQAREGYFRGLVK